MSRFLFLRDSSKRWIFLGENIEKSKDFIVNLMEKIRKKMKFIGGRKFYQELSFIEASMKTGDIPVLYPSSYSQRRAILKFKLFIEKEIGRHTLIIILILITLPFSAILGLLPGPNIIFWTELFVLYTYFKSVKGLKALSKNAKLIPDETLGKWEKSEKGEKSLKELKEEFSIENLDLLKG